MTTPTPRHITWLLLLFAIAGCRESEPRAREESPEVASSASTSAATTTPETTPVDPPEVIEWAGEGRVQYAAPITLLSEGDMILEEQRWKFGDYEGFAWRVRAPRGTALEILPSKVLQPVEDFASLEQGSWAILNGGFYEAWPDGEHPYRPMGVVRSGGEEHGPYRHRGGSGVLVIDDEGSPDVLHRDVYRKQKKAPSQALQSIDRLVSKGKSLVREREHAKMAARCAVVLTEDEVILVALASASSVRRFDGGVRLLGTSFLGLPLWAFADFLIETTAADMALNMDGGISTQMMVRLDGETFKVIGERGTINAVELRLR